MERNSRRQCQPGACPGADRSCLVLKWNDNTAQDRRSALVLRGGDSTTKVIGDRRATADVMPACGVTGRPMGQPSRHDYGARARSPLTSQKSRLVPPGPLAMPEDGRRAGVSGAVVVMMQEEREWRCREAGGVEVDTYPCTGRSGP